MTFSESVLNSGQSLSRLAPTTLQINVGKLCNLTCIHCHVNAGPKRKEIISRETIDRILDWLKDTSIKTVDLTGGTPEMIPDFKYLITRLKGIGIHIMDRLNATILQEPGYEDMAEFLAENEIELIASMPCYQPDNVTAQRGEGVFDASIAAFQKLNALGYATNPKLPLHFVFNPNGAALPPDQEELKEDYKREMKDHFGIAFNDLYAIANMPIARFASYLKREGLTAEYTITLKEAFNPTTIDGLMCRTTINVSWEGDVFDCDFNQMLKLPTNGAGLKVWDIDLNTFASIPIKTANHCYACTAGAGSSCGGALT